MDNNEMPLADYFGHETEVAFIDWAAAQLKEYRGVEVTDRSAVKFRMELGEQDGCCELCYTEDARVEVEYEGTVIVFEGYYSYSNYNCDLSLDSWRVLEK